MMIGGKGKASDEAGESYADEDTADEPMTAREHFGAMLDAIDRGDRDDAFEAFEAAVAAAAG